MPAIVSHVISDEAPTFRSDVFTGFLEDLGDHPIANRFYRTHPHILARLLNRTLVGQAADDVITWPFSVRTSSLLG